MQNQLPDTELSFSAQEMPRATTGRRQADKHHDVPVEPRRVSSLDIMAGERVVEIDHGGVAYRLRTTSQGKLILTK